MIQSRPTGQAAPEWHLWSHLTADAPAHPGGHLSSSLPARHGTRTDAFLPARLSRRRVFDSCAHVWTSPRSSQMRPTPTTSSTVSVDHLPAVVHTHTHQNTTAYAHQGYQTKSHLHFPPESTTCHHCRTDVPMSSPVRSSRCRHRAMHASPARRPL